MNDDIIAIAGNNRHKTMRAIAMGSASLDDFRPYDSTVTYTPKALEPCDALADRFVRAVECALRYFRSREMPDYAEQSDPTRTMLGRMEKLGLVSNADLWLAMRNVRNRIVHDYLPEQLAQMFELIAGEFGGELNRLLGKLQLTATH